MIAKVFTPAASFKRICWYVSQERSMAEILSIEGVRGHDHRLMARDFETIHALCPGRSNPVFHGVLLFNDQEKLENSKLITLARQYLDAIGYGNAQHAIIKHNDTRHPHLHIVANRIGYDGKYIENYPEMLRSKQAADLLIREYGLVQPGRKNLMETNWDGLDNPQLKRYAIYNHIRDCLPGCGNFEIFEQRLLRRGVDVRYNIDAATGRKRGISFRYQNEAFRGRAIDEAFSLPRLQQMLTQQLKMGIWEQERRDLGQKLTQEEELAKKQQQEELDLQQKLERKQEQTGQLHRGHSHRIS